MSEKIEPGSERLSYRSSGECGFTNDPDRLQGAKLFRDDAVADGWSIEPTYQTESVDRASRLRRDGFVMLIVTREKVGKWAFEAEVNIWGPDGLAIRAPEFYDFDVIEGLTRTCNYCGKDDVPTERVGFAGRCCASCLPEARKKIETPGWTN